MPRLTRDQVLAASDGLYEEVAVPEWGDGATVLVWTFSAGDRDQLESSVQDSEAKYRDFRARLVSLTVKDEAGESLFTMDDVPALSRKSAKAIERIVDVAMRINGIGQGDAPVKP